MIIAAPRRAFAAADPSAAGAPAQRTLSSETCPPRGWLSAAALAAAFAALAPAGALAQTSAPLCNPTPTVSSAADADSVYTTTVVCGPRAGKAAGEADYRHIHWNQRGGSRVVSGTTYTETARGTGTPANNATGNHVHLTVGGNVEFDADGMVDMRSFGLDGAVRLVAADATVVIENGAVLNVNRTPAYWSATAASRPSDGTENYYPAWTDVLFRQSAIAVEGEWGDLTVRHGGVINFNVRNRGIFATYTSASDSIRVYMPDTASDATRRAHDILVELTATGVIRHVAGSDGGNGIYAELQTEDGDIAINLAEGSRIDVSGEGGRGVYAHVRAPQSTYTAADAEGNRSLAGDVIVNAHGTIEAAVRNRPTVSIAQGVGIFARNDGTGRVRVTSSGTLETVQAVGIEARPHHSSNSLTDDPATPEIEGHLVDITGGHVETRGGTAIYTRVGSRNASIVVRVAEGATVRAQALTQEDYDNGAITQEQLGADGNRYVYGLRSDVYGWRAVQVVQRDENGRPTAVVNRLEPLVSAIAMTRWAAPATGVTDRVIVEGTVETIDESENEDDIWTFGSEDDPAIRMTRGGAVTVGPNGVVKAASGLAILAGVAPPSQPGPGYTAPESDLAVTVEGRIEGDIRVRDAGDLTVAVMAGGVVAGTLHDPQNPFTVGNGASIGRLLYGGDDPVTVTVADGGTLTGVEGKAVESASATAALTVTVNDGGRVEGDILSGGALTANVMDGGAVTGTLHDPQTPFTVGDGASIGRLLYGGDDPITVTVADGGTLTGVESKAVESASATAALTVTVNDGGRVEGDILSGGALTANVMNGGVVTGTLHDPQNPFMIGDGVGIGRLLYSGGATVTVARGGALTGVEIDGATEAIRGEAGNLDVTVAAGGEATGNIEGRGEGNLDVTVAGELTGDIAERGAGDLEVQVTGTVTGGVRGESPGGHTVDVATGGAVTGTVHLPTGALVIAGRVGRVRYDNGGRVTVNGAITGVETEAAADAARAEHGGATEAIRGDAGNLDVTVAANGDVTGNIEDRGAGNLKVAVAGEMTGDIVERGAGDLEVTVTGTVTGGVRAEGEGAHEVEVESAGTVTGTVRMPTSGAMTIKGRVGRVRYDNGGAVTVDANGAITGVEIEGAREAIRSEAGDLTVAVHGAVTGNIDGRGDGDLTVTVSPAGTVTGEIIGRGGGVHTIDIADEATVLGTVHNPKRGTTINGVAGRVRFDNGGALTIAATGRIAGIGGEAILSAAGDLEVAVAGKAAGRVESRGGALDATVTGTVEGDILGLGAGEHTVAIRDGGMVTGTVRLAASEVDVESGAVGRVLLDRGGSVKVGARGRIAGLEIEGAREAIRADAGNLEVAVASGGAVAGAIRGAGAGRHEVTVASGGSVTGDIVDLEAGSLVASIAGRVTGSIEERGAGNLDVRVSGTVEGGIRGLGGGAHDVHVEPGGSVEGLIHLAASEVTVDGAAASVRFDRGGTVAVGSRGRISGLEGRAVHSAAGDLTVEVNGVVMGSVSDAGAGDLTVAVANALTGDVTGGGGGMHRLTVRPGGVFKGNVRGVEFIRVAGRAEGMLNVPPGNEVTVPAGGRLIGAEDAQGRRVAIIAETGALNLTVDGMVEGAVEARDADAASTVTVGADGRIDGRVALAGADSAVGIYGAAQSVDVPRGMVTVGEGGRIEVETSGEGKMTIRAADDESDKEALERVGRFGQRIEVCIRRGENEICLGGVGEDDRPGDGDGFVFDTDGRLVRGENGRPLVAIGPGGGNGGDPDGGNGRQPVSPDGQPLRGPDGQLLRGPDNRLIFALTLSPRHRVYAALPSALLALNALPAHGGRRASAETPRGAFARIDAGGGERRPEPVTAETRHDYRRLGFEAGMEGAVGERGVFAVSVHHVRGRADVKTNGGRVEIAGTGARVSGAWFPGGSYHVSAQAVATLYETDLDSTRDGALARDVSGRGYAAGVEVGRRLELGRVTLTPRAGADWSMVELSSFTDSPRNERVSLDAGRRITARAGVRAESGVFAGGDGGVFATLDVEGELSGAMRVTTPERAFETDAEATWARFGLGAAHEWAGGRIALRAAANYAAARRGNRDFSGSATLTVRF